MNSLNLEKRRSLLGISQVDLSEHTGICTQTIINVEKGRPGVKYSTLHHLKLTLAAIEAGAEAIKRG